MTTAALPPLATSVVPHELVMTPTVQSNLEAAQLALQHGTCVLLRGSVGSGKTSIAMAVAKEFNAHERMIRISLDDTFDSKDLLGKFSASTTPGAFEWVPGPLTAAVEDGCWLLMAAFNSGLPIAEMQPGRMLLGVAIIAAGFGFYGVSTAQDARRRILQLEALRLQRRAMLAAQAMEHGEESRRE